MRRVRIAVVIARAAALLALAGVVASTVELGAFGILRVREWRALRGVSPRATLSVYRDEPWGGTYWREHQRVAHGPVEYHAYRGMRSRAYAGRTITIGPDGLRRVTHVRCDANAYRIDLFGGSSLWGYGSPDWLTIPSLLAERYAGAGRPVCIRNHGELVWTNTQALIELLFTLEHEARPPDLVLFYNGCDDVLTPYGERRTGVPSGFMDLARGLEERRRARVGSFAWLGRTNTAELIRRGWARVHGASVDPPGTVDLDRLAADIVGQALAVMRTTDALARAYGFKYAFFWQPVVFVGSKRLTEEERWAVRVPGGVPFGHMPEIYAKTYARVRAISDPHLHDLADLLDSRTDTLYVTMCHLAPAGNRLVADRIYDAVGRLRPPNK